MKYREREREREKDRDGQRPRPRWGKSGLNKNFEIKKNLE